MKYDDARPQSGNLTDRNKGRMVTWKFSKGFLGRGLSAPRFAGM